MIFISTFKSSKNTPKKEDYLGAQYIWECNGFGADKNMFGNIGRWVIPDLYYENDNVDS